MTKKDYVRPCIMVEKMNAAELICVSQGVTSDVGINYGGIDEEGEQDPAARRRYHDVWQDDEEDWD